MHIEYNYIYVLFTGGPVVVKYPRVGQLYLNIYICITGGPVVLKHPRVGQLYLHLYIIHWRPCCVKAP